MNELKNDTWCKLIEKTIVKDSFISDVNNWDDTYKLLAIDLCDKNIDYIKNTIKNIKMGLSQSILMCDLITIVENNVDEYKNDIIHILIKIYIFSPVYYDLIATKEFSKHKNLLQYVLNDYKELNTLLQMIDNKFYQRRGLFIILNSPDINPLMLDENNRNVGKIDLLKINYENFITLVDKLKCYIPFPKCLKDECSNKSLLTNDMISQSYDIVDFQFESQSLFKHNNFMYHGYRNIVFNSILLFKEITECMNFKDEITLEGSLPNYLINMYLFSCYSKKFNIDKVHPEDIKNFIKFIDQYPTIILSIGILESQIINYFQKYNIDYDDYFLDLCKKYKLRCMYLDAHNKNIDIIFT